MHEKFQHIFEEEVNGIISRFRNEDYILLDEEKAFIKEWIDYMKESIRSECIKSEDVKDLVKAVYTLKKCPLEDGESLFWKIFYEIGYLKD